MSIFSVNSHKIEPTRSDEKTKHHKKNATKPKKAPKPNILSQDAPTLSTKNTSKLNELVSKAVTAADKLGSKQICSKPTTSYGTHQAVCPLLHWTNNVCIHADFTGLHAFTTAQSQGGSQKSKPMRLSDRKEKVGKTVRQISLEERSHSQMVRTLEHTKCKAKTRNTQAFVNAC